MRPNLWKNLPELRVEPGPPDSCLEILADAKERLGAQFEYDGERIVASWTEEGRGKRARYIAEVDVFKSTVTVWRVRRRKRVVCRSATLVNEVLRLAFDGRVRALSHLEHTRCVARGLCLVPVYIGGRPRLIVADAGAGRVSVVPSYVLGDTAYAASMNASLGVMPPGGKFGEEEGRALRAALRELGSCGPRLALLAMLPHIQPHAARRVAVAVAGPGEWARAVLAAWPPPKRPAAPRSAHSLAAMLRRRHVVVTGRGGERLPWTRAVGAYCTRAALLLVPRGRPFDVIPLYPRGALAMVLREFRAADFGSAAERVYVLRASGGPRCALEWRRLRALAWLAAWPFALGDAPLREDVRDALPALDGLLG